MAFPVSHFTKARQPLNHARRPSQRNWLARGVNFLPDFRAMPHYVLALRDASGRGSHALSSSGFETDPWLLSFESSFDVAMDFDGANDYLIFDTQPSLRLARGLTWSCWVEFDTLVAQRTISYTAVGLTPGYFISCNGATPAKMSFGKVGQEHTVISATTLTTGTIYNVTATMSDDVLPFVTLYLNGEIDASGTMSSGAITPTGQIQFSDTSFSLNGRMWNPCCWNRCLSQGEVWSYYKKPAQIWQENDPDAFFLPVVGATPVSMDIQGMHEALGGIAASKAGLHESTSSSIASSAAGLHESVLPVVSGAVAGIHEALRSTTGGARPFIYSRKRRLR
jgi:hypothetical protein